MKSMGLINQRHITLCTVLIPECISNLLRDTSVVDVPAPRCVLRRVTTSSYRGHVDESATELSLLPHHEHGTG